MFGLSCNAITRITVDGHRLLAQGLSKDLPSLQDLGRISRVSTVGAENRTGELVRRRAVGSPPAAEETAGGGRAGLQLLKEFQLFRASFPLDKAPKGDLNLVVLLPSQKRWCPF